MHLSQDLCDTLCDTLHCEGWDSLVTESTVFVHIFNVVLCDSAGGQCSDVVSVWLKEVCWKVLAVM